MINNIKYLPGIGNGDHVCVQFDVVCYHSLLHNTTKPLYNLKLADFDKICRLIDRIGWDDVL